MKKTSSKSKKPFLPSTLKELKVLPNQKHLEVKRGDSKTMSDAEIKEYQQLLARIGKRD